MVKERACSGERSLKISTMFCPVAAFMRAMDSPIFSLRRLTDWSSCLAFSLVAKDEEMSWKSREESS